MGKSNLVRFDWAAKRLLRNKSNFVVLEGFLSVLLEDEIHIERIIAIHLLYEFPGTPCTRDTRNHLPAPNQNKQY